jgi:diacylglycerol kinase (ATP)
VAQPIGVLVNPTSGKGKGASAGSQVFAVLNELDVASMDLSGKSFDESLTNARAAVKAGSIRALLVVGGDGMVHLGVNACAKSNVPLAIVAAGTGNDAASTLHLPIDDVRAGVEAALAGLKSPRRVDLIQGSTPEHSFYSFGTISAGFDAIVNAKANRMRFPKGPSRYQVAMVLELLRFKGIQYRVNADGKERELEAMLCAVANAPAFGGGMLIAPHAKVDDEKLDLFIVHKISRLELLKVFPKVFTGRHVTHPAVEFVELSSARIDSNGLPVYSDGEHVGSSPLEVQVAPGALWVCAPA